MTGKHAAVRFVARNSQRKVATGREDPGPSVHVNRASYLLAARDVHRFVLGADRVDIRAWPVFTADARLVGTVDRLLIESATRKIRYISVALVGKSVREYFPAKRGSVLVPIGLVRRLDDRQAVALKHVGSNQLTAAPRLAARSVTRGDEDATLSVYGLPNSRDIAASDFYKRPEFDEGALATAAR